MSLIASRVTTITFPGSTIRSTNEYTGDAALPRSVDLPAGKPGTAGGAGVMTLGAGHGIVTSNTVDIYWDDGLRYGCTVDADDSTTITVSGGTGDVLPTTGDMIACLIVTIDIDFVANNIKIIAAACGQRTSLRFNDSGGVELALEILADGSWDWGTGMGTPNPMLDDTIVDATASNGSETAAILQIDVLFDSAS